MADFDSVCAAICLLTNAAADEGMPQPVSRSAMRRLLSSGTLRGLVLCDAAKVDPLLVDRARVLLSRAKRVYECLERYFACGYEVILPSDRIWPERLFALGDRMPQFLFIRGNRELLSADKVSVAGSRDILPDVQRAAVSLGAMLAREGFCLVSGGARGVDTAAEQGALQADGCALIVPALSEKRFFAEEYRRGTVESGQMLVMYDTLPDEPFSAQKAIARNHTIYALGEAAIAVAARDGVGGTWHGAMDCLAMRCTPVYIPQSEPLGGNGAKGLLARGAARIDWSQPLRPQLYQTKQMNLFSAEDREGTGCRQN